MAMFEKKKFKKATSKVPGIKLVELLIASIEIIHCSTVVDQPLLLIPEKQLCYNKIQLI